MEKYDVIGLLGEGSFGRVYKARRISNTSIIVALKVICKARRSEDELKGLRKEFEIQKDLHHPNIIKMLDSFETKNEIVVVTEFAQKALNTVLSKYGYFSEQKTQKTIWDLVSALNYLHSHRVLHRDLKPQNVLIDFNDRAKLCDFGFARDMSASTHVLTSIKGTPLYMAPELIEQHPYDYKADLWSLGCIMYELLVGAPPFCSASIVQLIQLIPKEPIQWPPYLSKECGSFLRGLLHKKPEERMSWDVLLEHPFVKGNILILPSDGNNKPLTQPMSADMKRARDQQEKRLIDSKNKQSEEMKSSKLTSKIENMSLDDDNEDKMKVSAPVVTRIETDEWIAFLEKTMQELISGEMSSVTQPNLLRIVTTPLLANSETNFEVLGHVAKLLSLPFVLLDSDEKKDVIEQIKEAYSDLKIIPNLTHSLIKLLLLSSDFELEEIRNKCDHALLHVAMLTAHLVHLEINTDPMTSRFLSQLNNTLSQVLNNTEHEMAIRNFLQCKKSTNDNRNLAVAYFISILTLLVRSYASMVTLVHDIIFVTEANSNKNNLVLEMLRHGPSILREKMCLLLLALIDRKDSKEKSPAVDQIWSRDLKETLEVLVFDSVGCVRNAAEKTVEGLKSRDLDLS